MEFFQEKKKIENCPLQDFQGLLPEEKGQSKWETRIHQPGDCGRWGAMRAAYSVWAGGERKEKPAGETERRKRMRETAGHVTV